METILQFGAGRFLRAFADPFIHQARASGQVVGGSVVAQGHSGDRASALRKQNCKYHVAIRGLQNGKPIDNVEEVASLSRALIAAEMWSEVLELARSPALTTILSNTTEAGYALGNDQPTDAPP